jgi:hypothetical protein
MGWELGPFWTEWELGPDWTGWELGPFWTGWELGPDWTGWELGPDWTGAENLEGAEDFFVIDFDEYPNKCYKTAHMQWKYVQRTTHFQHFDGVYT